ncbi:MAG: plasminogen-binding N-terminal domain-containing protein [Campylobacterota bacterium]|nr:plasminogen-binding N-terminal domain-containing protein [Campylobacterota bacterium]
MRKIILIALTSLPLFAGFFPSTTHTSISSINGNDVSLRSSLPATGMSGIVVHDYGNALEAVTHYIVQTSKGKAKLIGQDILHHEALPTIKTSVAKGDKVIGGYLYNNVLLLAPDAKTYTKITSSHRKKWIHPDLFALFLTQEGDSQPTKANLAAFAKKYQIGLIYIVRKNAAILLDPISGQIVNKKSMKNLPSKGVYPFFMRFEEIDTGWFSSKKTGNYYKIMESI